MFSLIKRLSSQQLLFILLVLAFCVSLAYSFYFRIDPVVDARAYDTIAWNVATGVGYAETPELNRAEDYSINRVGPGYQVFLAAIYIFFGHHYEIVWIIQALLHVASAALLFASAKHLFGERGKYVGFSAVFLFAFFIDNLELSAMLMTETLLLFLLVASLHSFIRFFQEPTKWRAALLGLTATAALMTRPTLLLALLIFVIFCLWKRYFAQLSVLLVCSLLLISPWAIRNYQIFGTPVIVGTAGGYDLWVGNNEEANGELEPSATIAEYARMHTPTQTSVHGVQEVLRFVKTQPLSAFSLLLIKTSVYFSAARPAAFWFHQHGLNQILTIFLSSVFAFILFSFGIAGAVLLWRKGELYRWLLLLALTAPLSVIPIVVETRYRYPLYPLLALFAGYALAVLWEKGWKKSGSEQKVLLWVTTAILFNTIFDFLRNLDTVKDKLGF